MYMFLQQQRFGIGALRALYSNGDWLMHNYDPAHSPTISSTTFAWALLIQSSFITNVNSIPNYIHKSGT